MAELNPAPTGRLAKVLEQMTEEEREALIPHLTGSTSADWLARTLKAHGYSVGPTTIKTYRAAMRELRKDVQA